MRTVYTHDVKWRIYLLDGSVIKKNPFRNSYSRLVYKYGEKPENKIEEHCVKKLDNKDEQSRIFEELIRTMQFEKEYHGHRTLFKKRLFLESDWFGKKNIHGSTHRMGNQGYLSNCRKSRFISFTKGSSF